MFQGYLLFCLGHTQKNCMVTCLKQEENRNVKKIWDGRLREECVSVPIMIRPSRGGRERSGLWVLVVLKKWVPLVPVPICWLQKFASDKNFLFKTTIATPVRIPQKFCIVSSYFILKSADMHRNNCPSINEFWMRPLEHQSLKMWQQPPRDPLGCFILLPMTLDHENECLSTGLQDGFVSERLVL